MQPSSSNDLTTRISIIEQRVKTLEDENRHLKEVALARRSGVSKHAVVTYVEQALPRTNLINPSFLKRAFTVWGHFFVANLIIALTVSIIYGCVVVLFFGLILGSLSQSW